MVNRTLARRYAIAIQSLARDENAPDRVGADLSAVATALEEPGAIHDFFVAPVIARPEKERVLLRVFDGKVHSIALHALLLLVRKRREPLLGAIVAEYLDLERAAHGAQTLTLTSARKLDRAEYQQLIARLERLYGKMFEVTEVVDPDLIGGVRIMMGDRRIDASISGRLDSLARELSTAS
ncbi:MAG TPA: ATP synthase F1 subunit delta [Candidatus Cybelea sp.]|jgi:F-type H+-transporting ATPase subunit delta|nr:ATP synthase F1 subunit delta [Candidatus Cybelea sp.]